MILSKVDDNSDSSFDPIIIGSGWLKDSEKHFVRRVYTDVASFNSSLSSKSKSILLFPAVNSRLRYLTHHLIGEYFFDSLKSVSIGEGSNRRTLIYPKTMEKSNENSYVENVINDHTKFSEPFKTINDKKFINNCKNSEIEKKKNKLKRPDKQLYTPPNAKIVQSNKNKNSNDSKKYEEELIKIEKIENDNFTIDALKEESEKSINRTSNLVNTNLDQCETESSWEDIYDDEGDYIKPHLAEVLKEKLNISDEEIKIECPKMDYKNFLIESEIDEDSKYAHILEIYDFSSQLRTQDIFSSLMISNSRNLDIKWVDETHCLAVFSSPNAALEAMKMPYHNIKLRPLSKGIKESRMKAIKCAEYLQPYKERPETSAILARRLVTSALGIKSKVSLEQRVAEKKKLLEAKERKKRLNQQTHNIWEGNV